MARKCKSFSFKKNLFYSQIFAVRVYLLIFRYVLDIPGGAFVGTPRPSHNNWFHILFNFIGPNNGEGFRIYHSHSGVLVANVTRYSFSSFSRIHGRIVIGRAFTAIDEDYSSVVMDDLLFFNQAVTDDEIKMLSRQVWGQKVRILGGQRCTLQW